jgi:hypothetical protein
MWCTRGGRCRLRTSNFVASKQPEEGKLHEIFTACVRGPCHPKARETCVRPSFSNSETRCEQILLMDTPDFARRMLTTHVANYTKTTPAHSHFSECIADGIVTATGPRWATQRTPLAPLFCNSDPPDAVRGPARPDNRCSCSAAQPRDCRTLSCCRGRARRQLHPRVGNQ